MDSINNRIQAIVNKLFGGKSASFAREIDVRPTTIANYLKSENPSKPTSDFLELVVSKLGVAATWLLTGQGEMQKPAQQVGDISNSNVSGVNVSGTEIHISNPGAYNALLETVNTYQKITEKYQAQMDEIIALLKAKI